MDSVSEGLPKKSLLKAAVKKARSPTPALVVLVDVEDIVGVMWMSDMCLLAWVILVGFCLEVLCYRCV